MKQEDTTVVPADDVTHIDFTGYTTVGVTGAGGGGSSFENISVSDEAYLNEISGYDLMLQGTFGSGTSLDVAGAGTRSFFYPKKGAFRAGVVSSTQWDDGSIGDYSFASGLDVTASGTSSIALGRTLNVSGDYGFATGFTNAAGYAAFVSGQSNTASGNYTHVSGNASTATANYSQAAGRQSNATDLYASAIGYGTTASGQASHAEGKDTTASGSMSHAEGLDTTATSTGSHAQGYDTVSSGTGSHSSGYATRALGHESMTQGSFLTVDTTGTNSVIFGSYSNATERDANKLAAANTMKLANMDLIVDGFAQFSNYTGGVPASGDCDADVERGTQIIDTGNNRLYICNGAARGWDYISLTD